MQHAIAPAQRGRRARLVAACAVRACRSSLASLAMWLHPARPGGVEVTFGTKRSVCSWAPGPTGQVGISSGAGMLTASAGQLGATPLPARVTTVQPWIWPPASLSSAAPLAAASSGGARACKASQTDRAGNRTATFGSCNASKSTGPVVRDRMAGQPSGRAGVTPTPCNRLRSERVCQPSLPALFVIFIEHSRDGC